MDIRGHIHYLDAMGAAESAEKMVRVPDRFGSAAVEAYNSSESIFHSRNRNASAWGRLAAARLYKFSKDKRRRRRANKAARIARRRSKP